MVTFKVIFQLNSFPRTVGAAFSQRHGCVSVSPVTSGTFGETLGTKTADCTSEEEIGVLFRFNAESISRSSEN